MVFLVTENGTFWECFPKWINLKPLARCVIVDSKNGTFWKRLHSNSHIISVAISSKAIKWTENILSVFKNKNCCFIYFYLSGLVWTKGYIRRKSCVFIFIRLSVNIASHKFIKHWPIILFGNVTVEMYIKNLSQSEATCPSHQPAPLDFVLAQLLTLNLISLLFPDYTDEISMCAPLKTIKNFINL